MTGRTPSSSSYVAPFSLLKGFSCLQRLLIDGTVALLGLVSLFALQIIADNF